MNAQPDRPQADEDNTETQDADAVDPAIEVAAEADAAAQPDVDSLKARAEEHWDKYLRVAAELENVRKRALRDIEKARKFALERFAADLLDVRDSLEMGLEAAADADAGSLAEGSAATLKLLVSTMERFGVEELNPEGEPFDPEVHEAMTMQPSADAEPGSVLQVFQKGYTLNGRLLRPARVIVASEPDGKE